MAFSLIQKPSGTLDILMYLSRKGATNATTIIKELRVCRKTFYSAVDRLKSLGLVFEKTKKGWPTRVFYQLTYVGEETIRYLEPLEKILVRSLNAKWEELEKLESARRTRKNKERMLDLLRNLQKATFDLGKWDETLKLSAKAVKLASSLRDDRNLSHAYRYAGLVYQKRSDAPRAQENLNKSIEVSTRTEDWNGASEDHYVLGALYERSGDLKTAIIHYKRSMGFAREAEWSAGEARARLGFGRILGRKGKIEDSLREIEQAVEEFERLEASHELARAYGNLGSTMFFLDKEKALEFFEKSIEMARRTGEVRMRAFGLSNAASCYIGKGELKKALEYLNEAEDIFTKLEDKPAIASIYIHRGCIHKAERRWRESEESFQRSMEISKEAGADYHLGDALFHYGSMLSESGETRRSESILQKALAIFEELGNEGKIAKVRKALESISR